VHRIQELDAHLGHVGKTEIASALRLRPGLVVIGRLRLVVLALDIALARRCLEKPSEFLELGFLLREFELELRDIDSLGLRRVDALLEKSKLLDDSVVRAPESVALGAHDRELFRLGAKRRFQLGDATMKSLGARYITR
jgi:hypothetical protein